MRDTVIFYSGSPEGLTELPHIMVEVTEGSYRLYLYIKHLKNKDVVLINQNDKMTKL